MYQLIQRAINSDLDGGPGINADWANSDDRDIANIQNFADAVGDSQHVATMPMYQASMTLQFEYARSQMKLKDALLTLKAQCDLVHELTRLIQKKRRHNASLLK